MQGTIRFISFLNSIASDKWVYYGESMIFYYTLYHIYDVFYLSDFALIKLISSMDEDNSVFNLEYFLGETNFDNNYIEFSRDNFQKENLDKKEFIKAKVEVLKNLSSKHTKNFNLFLKNLEYFLKLFIPENINFCLFKLFTYSLDQYNNNRLHDRTYEKFVKKKKKDLKVALRNTLIHIIFFKENSIHFSDLIKNLPYFFKHIFKEEDIELILLEIADCYQNKNRPNVYKLKQDFFQYLDLFSYYDPQAKSSAEKHYLDFTKDKFSFINSPEIDYFTYIKIFENRIYRTFFTIKSQSCNYNKNFDFIFNFMIELTKSDNRKFFNDCFIFIFMKFFSLFLNFYKENYTNANQKEKEESIDNLILKNRTYFTEKLTNEELISILNENCKSNNPYGTACKYLKEKIHDINPEIKETHLLHASSANQTPIVNSKSQIAKSKQELIKQKFLQKSQNVLKKLEDRNENNLFENTEINTKPQATDLNLNLNEENINFFYNKGEEEKTIGQVNLKNMKTGSFREIKNPKEDKILIDINENNEQISTNGNKNINQFCAFTKHKSEQYSVECIVCRNAINKNEMYTNPYGKIGILNSSSFINNSKLQTIKNEFERIILKNKFNEFQSSSIDNNNLKSNISSNNTGNNISIYESIINSGNNYTNNVIQNGEKNFTNSNINNFDLGIKESQMFSQITNQTFIMNVDENILLKEIMINYKKSSRDFKKCLRFTTCNHYIHISCFTKIIHTYINHNFKKLLFSCPLCKSLSNCIFPEIDIHTKFENPKTYSTEDLNEGVSFSQIFNYLNEKKQNEIEINYLNNHLTLNDVFGSVSIPENLIFACEDFIEKIISSFHKFIIGEFNLNLNKNKNNTFSQNNSRNSNNTNTTTKAHINTSINIFSNEDTNPQNDQTTNSNQEKYYETLKNFFINSLNLLDILKDDEYLKTLNILRIFILSVRMLIKSGSLEFGIFLNRFWNLFYFFKNNFYRTEAIVNYVDNDHITNNFLELLMLTMFISNLSELIYLKNIFKHYVPFFLLQFLNKEFYIHHNFKTSISYFEKYFRYDELIFLLNSGNYSEEIKKHLNFYLRKLTILIKIHGENFQENFIQNFKRSDEEFGYYTKELGFKENYDVQDLLTDENDFYPTFIKINYNSNQLIKDLVFNYNLFKTKQLREIADSDDGLESYTKISPYLLLITSNQIFKFIDLPNNAMDLTTKYGNSPCPNCKKKVPYSILCLICGEKLCYMKNCCFNLGRKQNEMEYSYHTKICLNGEGLYLQLFNGEILASLNKNYVNIPGSALYLNKYGESFKEKRIGMEYILNEEKFRNCLSEFKNMKFTRYFKSFLPDSNDNNDENNENI